VQVIGHTSNFLDNMRLPVHRWFRYSAGFSAEWVKWLLAERNGSGLRVLDPFVGSGTTCLACDEMSLPSYGIEAHPFVHRAAQAKLSYTAEPERFISKAEDAFGFARKATAQTEHFPEIIRKCFALSPKPRRQQVSFCGARLCAKHQPQRVDARERLVLRGHAAVGRDDTAALRVKMRIADRQNRPLACAG
jgi:hypothetical protein